MAPEPEGADPGLTVLVNQVGDWPLPRDLLERGVLEVLRAEEMVQGEVSLTFLGDDGIADLNREFLKRSEPTDVIAFALQGPGESLLGDIYVGYDQACRQAEDLSVPLEEELLRLAIHGTLHLLGHEHPEGGDRTSSTMFRLQEELLARVLSR